MERRQNIALLPPPVFLGHLIPFIEFAKKLISHHNCTVTLIILHDGSTMKPQKALLEGLPSSVNPIFLPSVPTDDLANADSIQLPIHITNRSLPALRTTLSSLIDSGLDLAALVVDLFTTYAMDVAKEFEIPAYIFYVIAATELALSTDLPKLDKLCKTLDSTPESIQLPGSILLSPDDLPVSAKERNSEVHKWELDLCKKYLLADGIMVNSFLGLESEAFEDLKRRGPAGVPPIYPIGPLIRTGKENQADWEGSESCLKWLDNQPPRSVLFVSFGSGGTVSMEQLHELAFGLEMSGQRFLWVVRCPQENAVAAYMNTNRSSDDPLTFLPEGFLERTKGKGIVVASWAPQIEVLSHGSTGGFVTHCGWNSVLESSVFGVPMIAWPICFEQKMNAAFVTDCLKAALRVKQNDNGIVEKEYIAKIVQELIEGKEGQRLQKRMIDVKNAAATAVSPMGSSTKALHQVVKTWINHIPVCDI